ncbi:GDSL esterase/lipase EXL1-like protein [Drosera capensis]
MIYSGKGRMHQKMPSPTKISAISIIIHVLVLHRGTHSQSLPQNVTVPAIFFFGDSVVDPGNSDWILSVCRADHPPYGRDFEGGVATGRFSNAKIPSDYTASANVDGPASTLQRVATEGENGRRWEKGIELYNLGARRIGAIGLPPQGCLPAMRTSAEGHSRPCNKQYNQNAMLFNSKLESLMGSLGKNLTGAKLVYLDLYGPLLQLVKNPENFGFTIANRGCCGQGETEVSFICSPFDPRTCKNDSKYVFWDAYHPTDAACKIIVHKMLSKTINKFF